MVHAWPLFCLFLLIGKLQHLASSLWKLPEISHFCSCYTFLLVSKTRIFEVWQRVNSFIQLFVEKILQDLRTSLQIWNSWNLEISSWRSSFGSLFFNWKVITPCQVLTKITYNITFLELLCSFICSINKAIWNVWQEVSSLIHLIFEKISLCLTASLQIWNSPNKTEKMVQAKVPFVLYFLK